MRLFSFKPENAFRLYSLLFSISVLLERSLWWEWGYGGRVLYEPSFYSANPIRLSLLLFPFFYVSFFKKTPFYLQAVKANVPFLFLGLFTLALPTAQLFYFLLFILSCFFIKGLRVFGGIVLGGTVAALMFKSPLFVGLSGTPSVAWVKGNMYAFQSMLETYAVDHNGTYPPHTQALQTVAKQENYWKDFQNPVTGKTGPALSFRDISETQLTKLLAESKQPPPQQTEYPPDPLDVLGIRILSIAEKQNKQLGFAGEVLYYWKAPNRYAIYGSYHDGNRLIVEKGIPVFLSNAN